MTVCDRCRKPRDVNFSVYPYVLKLSHENLPEHNPQMSHSLELCKACATHAIFVIGQTVAALIVQQDRQEGTSCVP